MLGLFPTDTFTPILSSSSQALTLDLSTRIDSNTCWVYTSPNARLTDVVRGALGSGVRKAESSVIISCHPGSDQNDKGSSHQSVTERPQMKGGRGLLPLTITTLRTYFWQNSVEMLKEKSHCSFHVPLCFGPLLKFGPNFF